MGQGEWDAVAGLITRSTNEWYESKGLGKIFHGEESDQRIFCEVYEALDPGCCLVMEDDKGELMGSCFYHPRETHVSLGIMNVSPDHFGKGVAGKLLREVIALAEERDLPVRLVSSAMNLDSFSLYNRHGFVPRAVYQDLLIEVPEKGVSLGGGVTVREAEREDVSLIAALENDLAGIDREKDWGYFFENENGCWHVSVAVNGDGWICGVLASICHPASKIIGPGVARDAEVMRSLIEAELNHRAGETMLLIVPAVENELIRELYQIGARNCELHFAQCRGEWVEPKGVVMPSFLPETA